MSTEPVAPTIDVTALIELASAQAGWDTSLTGRGLLSAEQTSKVLCGLSQQVDKSVVTAIVLLVSAHYYMPELHRRIGVEYAKRFDSGFSKTRRRV